MRGLEHDEGIWDGAECLHEEIWMMMRGLEVAKSAVVRKLKGYEDI